MSHSLALRNRNAIGAAWSTSYRAGQKCGAIDLRDYRFYAARFAYCGGATTVYSRFGAGHRRGARPPFLRPASLSRRGWWRADSRHESAALKPARKRPRRWPLKITRQFSVPARTGLQVITRGGNRTVERAFALARRVDVPYPSGLPATRRNRLHTATAQRFAEDRSQIGPERLRGWRRSTGLVRQRAADGNCQDQRFHLPIDHWRKTASDRARAPPASVVTLWPTLVCRRTS